VKDALTAASIGIHENGVTAMHDATEGGVVAAVIELATASNLGAELNLSKSMISDETAELCKFFRIDPWTSLSEGSLIIACRPGKTSKLLSKLNSKGIQSRIIGHMTSRGKAVFATTGGRRNRVSYPKVDPYWKVYWKGIEKGWR
jgi:hydrogenase expression/formation protein HypE